MVSTHDDGTGRLQSGHSPKEIPRETVGGEVEAISATGVNSGLNQREENGVSAFETITQAGFPGKCRNTVCPH